MFRPLKMVRKLVFGIVMSTQNQVPPQLIIVIVLAVEGYIMLKPFQLCCASNDIKCFGKQTLSVKKNLFETFDFCSNFERIKRARKVNNT